MAQGDLYDVGDVVELDFYFTDANGPVDPTTVTVLVRAPDGTVTTYTYANNDIDKVAVGHYRLDLPVDADGRWRVRAVSTGTGQAAVQAQFEVQKPNVVSP